MREVTDELADMFDGIYTEAGRDDASVPWQHAASRDLVARWLGTLEPGSHRRALVVAAGLGDDAAALARRGLEVVAFDRSPAAVEWAQERHAGARVSWAVADLFDAPAEWVGAFDLVLEVFTVQSVPPELQVRAAEVIAGFLAPGGVLVVVAVVGEPGATPSGPPWPLDPRTLEHLERPLGSRPALHLRGGEEEPLGPAARLVRRDLQRPTA